MKRPSGRVSSWHAIVISAAVAAAALLVTAPLAARGGGFWRAVVAGVYLAGSLICHQQPERSFHLAGAQLPVCARCSGLYLAAAAGILATSALIAVSPGLWQRARRLSWRNGLIVAAVPTAVTVGLEWLGAWAPGNLVRAVAALPLGLAVGSLLAASLSFRGKL